MIILNDICFETDIKTILEQLKEDAALTGKTYFLKIKSTNDYFMTNCPFHKNGMENNPSCGVHKQTGTFHCFTCGYTGTLLDVIKHIFNFNGTDKSIDYLKSKYLYTQYSKRSVVLPEIKRKYQNNDYVPDSELQNYRYYHNYMFERKLTEPWIKFFDVGYDKHTNCITFPVNDISGNCVFVARRGVSTKFFNYPLQVKKPVYALDKIVQNSIKEVWVCESFINCINCWQYGFPAVALMGTGTTDQFNQLKSCGIHKYVLAFDGDEAGDKACQKFVNYFKDIALIDVVILPRNKDINDLTLQQFYDLQKIHVNY